MEEVALTDQGSSRVRKMKGLKVRYWHLVKNGGKNSKERNEIVKNG